MVSDADAPVLSVVIITRNEAATIGVLIESVLAEVQDLNAEIVVVDSSSTDNTTQIAAGYPVQVLRLAADQPLSPAAGRHVGFWNTSAALVLFLDGDMTLFPQWLRRAQAALRERPALAVVTGTLVEGSPEGQVAAPGVIQPSGLDGIAAAPFAAGAGLYRRSVLEAVGGFNPYLRSDEEPDVGLRIRRFGYGIAQTSYPIAIHWSAPSGSLRTLLGRWRRGLFLGAGQNLRYLWGSPIFWPYVRERGFGLPPLVAGAFGGACAIMSAVTHDWRWIIGWGSAMGAAAVLVAIRIRNPRRAVHAMLQRLLIADGTARGILMRALPPSDYPGRFEFVSAAPQP